MGTLLTEEHVKVAYWPASTPVQGAFTDKQQVIARGLLASVVENEPLTNTKLAPPNTGGGLPPQIKENYRAISVKVNEVIGVAGFVVPGARVDVIVTIRQQNDSTTRVVVSNVQVLTAGTAIDQDKAKDGKPVPNGRDADGDAGRRRAHCTGSRRGAADVDAAQPARRGGDVDAWNHPDAPGRHPEPQHDGQARRSRSGRRAKGAGQDHREAQARRDAGAASGPQDRHHQGGQTRAGDSSMSRTRHAALSVLGSSALAAGRKAISLALIAALTSGSVVSVGAQTPPLPQAAPAVAQAIETLTLVSGRSMVLPTAFDVVRIAVTDPAIADAVVVVPREILIDGKAPGTVSLIVWGKAERRQFDVVVEPSAGSLQRQMRTLFPDDTITVSVTDEAIVLSGRPASQDMVVRAARSPRPRRRSRR